MATIIKLKLKDDLKISLVGANSKKFNKELIIIPAYVSKGLEFDSVIISDFNKYSENILDTKLLYVACTRAMHTLDIIVTKDQYKYKKQNFRLVIKYN